MGCAKQVATDPVFNAKSVDSPAALIRATIIPTKCLPGLCRSI